MDTLAGHAIDDNARAVRQTPGRLAGMQGANEFTADDVADCMETGSVSRDTPLQSESEAEDGDFGTPLVHRGFHDSWGQIQAAITDPFFAGTATKTAAYAASLSALSAHIRPPPAQTGRLVAQELCRPGIRERFALIQRDVQHWRRSINLPDVAQAPALPGMPCSPPNPDAVLSALHEQILRGEYNMPDGQLNRKQALFLLVFALNLRASRLNLTRFWCVCMTCLAFARLGFCTLPYIRIRMRRAHSSFSWAALEQERRTSLRLLCPCRSVFSPQAPSDARS